MKEGTRLYRDGGYNDIYTTAVNEELELLAMECMDVSAQSIAEINNNL